MSFPWPQYESALKEMVAASLSRQQIADRLTAASGLHVTDLMVCSRMRRSGLVSRLKSDGEQFWAQWEPRLRELIALNHPVRDISSILTTETGRAVSPKMVTGKLRRRRLKAARAKVRVRHPRDGGPERRERVLSLWKQGLTAGQIEQELRGEYGISRSAVMGIVKRARERGNLEDQTRQQAPIAKKRLKPSRTLASTGFVHCGTLPFPNPSASPKPAAPRPEPQEKPLGLLLMDLEDKQCRWPLDTESEGIRDRWLFCGLPKMDPGDPACRYCLCHWKRSMSEEGLRREMAKRRRAA